MRSEMRYQFSPNTLMLRRSTSSSPTVHGCSSRFTSATTTSSFSFSFRAFLRTDPSGCVVPLRLRSPFFLLVTSFLLPASASVPVATSLGLASLRLLSLSFFLRFFLLFTSSACLSASSASRAAASRRIFRRIRRRCCVSSRCTMSSSTDIYGVYGEYLIGSSPKKPSDILLSVAYGTRTNTSLSSWGGPYTCIPCKNSCDWYTAAVRGVTS
mmetsp:Transcript_35945/g.101145  ORF Transcript_35945/g.101145 Transcript_35945/m.101145 type:complete len:212 (-) Transcript_35945:143-778(-)